MINSLINLWFLLSYLSYALMWCYCYCTIDLNIVSTFCAHKFAVEVLRIRQVFANIDVVYTVYCILIIYSAMLSSLDDYHIVHHIVVNQHATLTRSSYVISTIEFYLLKSNIGPSNHLISLMSRFINSAIRHRMQDVPIYLNAQIGLYLLVYAMNWPLFVVM